MKKYSMYLVIEEDDKYGSASVFITTDFPDSRIIVSALSDTVVGLVGEAGADLYKGGKKIDGEHKTPITGLKL